MRAKQVKKYLKKGVETNSSRSYFIKIALLALVYIALAKFGLALAFTTDQVTTVWPPTGMALAALLILGYRFWPGMLLGAFVANMLTDETVPIATSIAVGNTLEALVGAYLLRRLIKFDFSFSRISDFLGLLVLSGAISTLISATIGTLSLTLGGIVEQEDFGFTWLTWWIGDMMGALIFAPLILIFFKDKFAPLRQRPMEASLLLMLSLVVSIVIFSQNTTSVLTLPYLVFPIIIWAALRFTQTGAAVIVAVIAGVAVWGTIGRLGPFASSSSTEEDLILMQTFILVMTITAMLMAIIVAQRQRVERALRSHTDELIKMNGELTNLLAGGAGKSKARSGSKNK